MLVDNLTGEPLASGSIDPGNGFAIYGVRDIANAKAHGIATNTRCGSDGQIVVIIDESGAAHKIDVDTIVVVDSKSPDSPGSGAPTRVYAAPHP